MGFSASVVRAVALFAVGLSLSAVARPALAVPKPKPHPAASRKPPPKNPKKAEPDAEKPDADAKGSADASPSDDKPDAEKPDKGEPSAVKAAGTTAGHGSTAPAAGAVVKEDKQGVKTYKFGTIEVEGRLKSPQIIYFLRRVRAEFDAGLLGHRSFMRELSDTRNQAALR